MADAAYETGPVWDFFAIFADHWKVREPKKHGAQKARGPRDEGPESTGLQKVRPQKLVPNLGPRAFWGTPLDMVTEV